MSDQMNTQVKLVQRPVGEPAPECFQVEQAPVTAPADGEVLYKVLYISLDPAMRGWMNEGKSYIPPVGLGEVMRAGGVGRVIQSAHPDFKEGDYVSGHPGAQEYAVEKGGELIAIDPDVAPLQRYLGVLGMPGITAYFGLLDVGQPKAGETVLISGAAGAVGSTVGQIAKLKGCRVVGIAGGAEKCDFLRELGFDAVIDYKSENIFRSLKQACPDGVDVFFDNVGGPALEAALARLRFRGRVVLCGAISQYNATERPTGPSNYMSLLVNRARMEGFVVFDYKDRYAEAVREMAGWIEQGKLQAREHVVEGLPQFHSHLMMLFHGENFGKLVLKVADDA